MSFLCRLFSFFFSTLEPKIPSRVVLFPTLLKDQLHVDKETRDPFYSESLLLKSVSKINTSRVSQTEHDPSIPHLMNTYPVNNIVVCK